MRDGMEGFLVGEFADKFERSANVLGGEVVFTLDLLESHPGGKAADNERDRHAGAANHRLAVTYGRVNDDAIMRVPGKELPSQCRNSKAVSNSFRSFSRASATAAWDIWYSASNSAGSRWVLSAVCGFFTSRL